jgi:PncC family amidohydrolase
MDIKGWTIKEMADQKMSNPEIGDPTAREHTADRFVTDAEMMALARAVGERLATARMMCATAESCTGGLVGHWITEISGSSAYFAGGAIVYSYAAKETVLGVRHQTLMQEGAVSYAVAQEMAQGALRLYAADVAVAITGVAGPGGGSPEKPVGTVHVHLSAADGTERGERYVWNADRSGNKLLSAQAALHMLLEYLQARSQDEEISDGAGSDR